MEKVTNRFAILLFLFLFFSNSYGQDPDSLKMVDTSLIPKDTTELKSWEIMYADTLSADSLSREPQLDIHDSLCSYFLSDRFDLSDHFVRSYGHDAGDFIKSNPSNFSVDYQPIPLRKTVAPFGLPGNRLDVIMGDRALHPVEHLPEPDNQIGFDEIPTAEQRSGETCQGAKRCETCCEQTQVHDALEDNIGDIPWQGICSRGSHADFADELGRS